MARRKVTIKLRCSNCGDCRELTSTVDDTVDSVKEGWGSYSTNLYCPQCSRTWKERNFTEMNGEDVTFKIIMNMIYEALKEDT